MLKHNVPLLADEPSLVPRSSVPCSPARPIVVPLPPLPGVNDAASITGESATSAPLDIVCSNLSRRGTSSVVLPVLDGAWPTSPPAEPGDGGVALHPLNPFPPTPKPEKVTDAA